MHLTPPRFRTQAEADAQYNPSLRLADPAAPLRHYTERAEEARRRLRCTPGVSFGPTPQETLDIYPADAPGAPVFVFFHGGYWRALSSADFGGVALGLQPLGITTVVPNYALCPAVTIDEITRQARAAVAWTLRHIGEHGGDPSRVAVGGHSAGAHLAAMCLQTDWAGQGFTDNPLGAGLLISGLYELEPLRHSYLQPVIRLDDGVIARNSPAHLVRRSTTPLWIAWGDAETTEFARQSAVFHAAGQRAGNRSELAALPGADHFSAIHGFETADSPLCRWLARHLGAKGDRTR